MITRELQEWHKQQVSKYKNLTTVSPDETETTNERVPSPILHQEETDMMITSALPSSSDDSRTICSSSFIVTEEPITIPAAMSTSLSINTTNENSIYYDNSRFVLE